MNSRKLIIVGVLAALILVPFAIFAIGILRRAPQSLPATTLSLWAVSDDKEAFEPVISAYKQLHRNVNVQITVKRPETYEQELLEAWAKGIGPDIFSVPVTSLGRYQDFITPMPQATRVPYYVDRKFLWKTDTVIEFRNDAMLTQADLQNRFVDTVARDVVRNGSVYGLPFAMDTAVLYFNRDLLNSAQIVSPARTWDELVAQVPGLTVIDQSGNIVRSGAALGTAANIAAAPDLLSLLMMQNGALMTDSTGRQVSFDKQLSDEVNPGARAVSFYTDFANLSKVVYAWNDKQADALDAFISGNVAYYFGYGDDAATIRARAADLNWGMTEMLHLSADGTDNLEQRQNIQINIPRYWVWAAAKQSTQTDLVWNFIQYAADANRVPAYLEQTGKVSALRSVLERQVNNADIAVIAKQALSARNWYHGENAASMENALRDLITSVVAGADPVAATRTAAKQIQLTYEK